MGFAQNIVSCEHQNKQQGPESKVCTMLHDMLNHPQMFESIFARSEACASSIIVNGAAETGSAQL